MTEIIDTDVVVLGTGGSGLTAAILSHDHGASTVLIEKSSLVGGTTAMSGGAVWIPNNSHARKNAIEDSRELALTYMKACAGPTRNDRLLEVFVDAGPRMLDYLEANTPVRFETHETFPDYHPELPGGKTGGRTVDPAAISFEVLGDWQHAVTPTKASSVRFTLGELERLGGRIDAAEAARREERDVRATGHALIGSLLRGCLDRKIPVHVDTHAQGITVDGGVVTGVRGVRNGHPFEVRARKAVILATGGFEWDSTLVDTFLRGPMTGPASAPENEGDGLRMAMSAGCSLANMSESWWMPTVAVAGEDFKGRPAHRIVSTAERGFPHAVIVNRRGRRFANEACNYNTFGRSLHEYQTESTTFGPRNLPAWLVFDDTRQQRMPWRARGIGGEGGMHPITTGDAPYELPEGVRTAPTVHELAVRVGIDPEGLRSTLDRFNRFAREGLDPDFNRGTSAYDRFIGDPLRDGAFATLGPVEQGPFYAVEIASGTIGTKGGPRIDEHGRVLNAEHEPIRGLYAAGNAAGSPTGMAYFGAGCTIGQGMTFGFLAGRHAAGVPARQ